MGIFGEFIGSLKIMNKNVRWFMVCVFVNGLIMSALNIVLGIYYKNIGLTEAAIGSLLSLRTLGISIGAFFAIILVQTLGTKRGLLISFTTMILSGLAFVNITIMPVMQVTSLLFGAAQAVFTVVQAPFLKKNSNDQTVVGTFSASFVLSNLAMFTGSFLFGFISDFLAGFGGQTFGRQTVLNGGLCLLVIVLFCLTRIDFGTEAPREKTEKQSLKSYFKILNASTWMYMLQIALFGIGAGLVVPFFSVYIKESLAVSDSVVGVIMSIAQFGTVLGGLMVPFLSRRLGRVRTVIACQLLSIPFLISISFPQGVVLMTISFFFRSSLMNMTLPILQSLAMDLVAEKNRTIMSSIFSLTENMFRAVGTSAGGWLMLAVSYNSPYYVTILMYLLSTWVIYVVFGKNEKFKSLY